LGKVAGCLSRGADTAMKFKYIIYVSAAFAIAYLVLKNPTGYQVAMNKFTAWFSKSFSAFGRVTQQQQ
jgi:hypothetical protein